MKEKKYKMAPVPFESYRYYGPIFNRSKTSERNVIVLIDNNNPKNRTSISYARFLMSIHLGRILDKSEQVDHINGIKSDDRIENLQILSHLDNAKKSAKGRSYVELVCPICNKNFIREKRLTHLIVNKKQTHCSRECLYESFRIKNSKSTN